MLPKDPFILLSFINTQLRDKYTSFDEFTASEGVDPSEITSRLSAIDYVYDEKKNQFI